MLIRILQTAPNFGTGLIIFILVALALILSLSIHEFAHAYVAYKLGDPTAKVLGRVSLDPRVHLDLTGTILLLFAGFGWGKPVPVNESNLSVPKRDSALVSAAGPISNILLAVIFALLFHFGGLGGGLVGLFVQLVVRYNIILAVFNLLPINPLDGFKVVNGILPEELSYQWIQIGQYGVWILLALVLTGTIDRIINPIIDLFFNILQI